MKLTRLAIVSIISCSLGLVMVAFVGGKSYLEMRDKQNDMQEIIDIESMADNFTAASNTLLSHQMDAPLWRAFLSESEELKTRLYELAKEYNAAHLAVHQIDHIIEVLGNFYPDNDPLVPASRADNDQTHASPLDISLKSQILINTVNSHAISLDTAMKDLAVQRKGHIVENANWIARTVGGAAALFGFLCITAFILMFRRLHGPLRSLSDVMAQVESGNNAVRAPSWGNDEFGELSRGFNRMLDQQQSDKRKLEERARLLDLAGKLAQIGSWSVDLSSQRCHWDDIVADIHDMPPGYSPDVDKGIAFYAPEHQQCIRERFSACVREGIAYDEELQIITTKGERRWVRTIGVPVRDEAGNVVRVEGALQDVSSRHEMMDRLRDSLTVQRALINSLPANIAMLDVNGQILDVNDQWRQFANHNDLSDPNHGVGSNYLDICRNARDQDTDYARQAARGVEAVLAGRREAFSLEYPCHSPTKPRWYRLMVNRLESESSTPDSPGAVIMHLDITERKQSEQQLTKLAYEDTLTGLLNRHGFIRKCSRYLDIHGWQENGLVVMLDIKGLSDINDAHGYRLGDELLKSVGCCLTDWLGHDMICRLNGDSFVLFIPCVTSNELDLTRKQLDDLFGKPFDLAGITQEVSARFSFTVLGNDKRPVEQLLHEVELAMFEVRRQGLHDWGSYSEDLDQKVRQRIQITEELRQAIVEQQFELHFQPKVSLHTGDLTACEALIRWSHPERGILSPGAFIPIAEQSQLIVPIGKWVLFEACRHLRKWQDKGLTLVQVSINVSMVQFEHGDFIDNVRDAITTYGIDPAGLTLEITESVFAQQSKALLYQMNSLHALGIRLSLDDFGTGYSSLLYLQQYPFDEIKIDMGFVRPMLDDEYSHRIVKTVLGITQVLGAEAVAEGIENIAVRDALVELGCHIGQGYYYSMPLEAEDFEWLLEKRCRLPLMAQSVIQQE